MKFTKIVQLVVVMAFAAAVCPRAAQAANGDDRAHKFQAGLGGGFTFSPRGLNLGIEGNYYVTNNISLAPQFSYTSFKDADLFTIAAEGRYTLDFKGTEVENSLKPWVGAGVGMIIINPDGGAKNDNGAEFQMSAGLDYYFSRQFSLGTNMSTIFPVGIYHESFILRWQVLQAKFLF